MTIKVTILEHPDNNHTLVFASDCELMIRVETNLDWIGWVEIGLPFSQPVMFDSFKEWKAFMEMINAADEIVTDTYKKREEHNKREEDDH